MTKLEALEVIRNKAGELEDLLQGDKGDKTVLVVDPYFSNEIINNAADGLQKLIQWASEETKQEELKQDDLHGNDEIFEEEKIITLDDELADRGLARGMY